MWSPPMHNKTSQIEKPSQSIKLLSNSNQTLRKAIRILATKPSYPTKLSKILSTPTIRFLARFPVKIPATIPSSDSTLNGNWNLQSDLQASCEQNWFKHQAEYEKLRGCNTCGHQI